MRPQDSSAVDRQVCRVRIALSLFSLVSMYVDPMVGGLFAIDTPALGVLAVHLCYSLIAYRVVTRGIAPPSAAPLAFAIVDVTFASAIAVVTEGVTSPAYVFFCFAIIAVAFREGLRATVRLTLISMPAYLLSILALSHDPHPEWLMRPGYLGLIGFLAGSLGQQHIEFEARVRELEAAAERRTIARSLHDGHLQALASTRLRLEACRALIVGGRTAEAVEELTNLQSAVTREFDDVRSYVRALAQLPLPAMADEAPSASATRFHLHADFSAGGAVTEQILQILLEGLRNTLRHGAAATATLEALGRPSGIHVRLDDDGVGFGRSHVAPWAIASRVTDLGGSLEIEHGRAGGAHLSIELPRRTA